MKKYSGKKLLILGSNVSSDDIVMMARENGAYTIVADYLPVEKSFAKSLADEHIETSTADITSLCEYVEKNKVDAVLAGISEFNLQAAMEVAHRCGLYFYCTKTQWDMLENKAMFRDLCNVFNVPVPETYYVGGSISEFIHVYEIQGTSYKFPVIMKPVDACASNGIFICHNEKEIERYFEECRSFSKSGNVIIEQFVNGVEFAAHYCICNDQPSLLTVDNSYRTFLHGDNTVSVPIARVYPCLFLERYLARVNCYVIDMLKSIGLHNAVVFIQAIYDRNEDEFYIFEAGLRFAGEGVYRFSKDLGLNNPLNLLLDQCIFGESMCKFNDNVFEFNGKVGGVISFASPGGVVARITGLDVIVDKLYSLVKYELRYPEGSSIPCGDTLKQLVLRFVLVCRNREEMAKDIDFINNNVDVLDEHGNSIVVKFNSERIFDIL